MDELTLRHEELVTNPTARVPICLCLDTSSSMAGEPIAELERGVASFFEEVMADELARHAAEVAIVTFAESAVRVVDFASLERQQPPRLHAAGSTAMGAGVDLALDLLEARKREYAQVGIDYYQPWLVLMTDGEPTDSIEGAARRTAELVEKRKLATFPIGIGARADLSVLSRFGRQGVRLQGLRFQQFFSWLSRSVSRVSQSIPGTNVPLDQKGLQGWAQL